MTQPHETGGWDNWDRWLIRMELEELHRQAEIMVFLLQNPDPPKEQV